MALVIISFGDYRYALFYFFHIFKDYYFNFFLFLLL